MKAKKENLKVDATMEIELTDDQLATVIGGYDDSHLVEAAGPGHRKIDSLLPNDRPKGKGLGHRKIES